MNVWIYKLWNILSKVSQYQQPKPTNLNSAEDGKIKGVEQCISAWYFKNGGNTQLQQEWMIKVPKLIDEFIKLLARDNSVFIRTLF